MMAGATDPANGAFAVTASDSTTLAGVRSLYIGVSGDVAVVTPDRATSVVFKSVPVGILPVRAVKVLSTGTTATNILALT